MRTLKHTLITIFSLLMITLIFTQDADLLTKKITIENSLREKVSFAIGKIIDQSHFVVIVNVSLGQNITNGSQQREASQFNVAKDAVIQNDEDEQVNGYNAIPGLPALPSQNDNQSTAQNNDISLGDPNKKQTPSIYSNVATSLHRIDVTVYLEEALATAGTIKDVGIIIRDVVPQTAQCSDCIRFETMRFKSSQDTESSTITELVKKIEELETERLEDERERKDEELDMLKVRLKNAEDARILWENEARQREVNRQRADSLKLAEFVEREKTHQQKRDSLLEVKETGVREVIQERLSTEAKYAERSFDLLEKQLSNPQNSYRTDSNNNDFAGMGMQYPRESGTSNWLLYLLLGFAIIALAVVSLTRKPKTIYLKPKASKQDQAPPVLEQQPVLQQKDIPISSSTMNEDEDVLRSELKSVRQTAVSMSVGQKESAANIVKNWLEDSSESTDDNPETSSEKKEGKSK
ncbi:MAG: hypothetical protein ISR90_06045 [Candidatus Marinimicrobia bacterium]|nr:hypothetical protein [Candidatus Neomarinimicrobiota bacterium]MBL7023594.1 hypothetical protein [Candidatus Neomarinimicrobiota bacterium]